MLQNALVGAVDDSVLNDSSAERHLPTSHILCDMLGSAKAQKRQTHTVPSLEKQKCVLLIGKRLAFPWKANQITSPAGSEKDPAAPKLSFLKVAYSTSSVSEGERLRGLTFSQCFGWHSTHGEACRRHI